MFVGTKMCRGGRILMEEGGWGKPINMELTIFRGALFDLGNGSTVGRRERLMSESSCGRRWRIKLIFFRTWVMLRVGHIWLHNCPHLGQKLSRFFLAFVSGECRYRNRQCSAIVRWMSSISPPSASTSFLINISHWLNNEGCMHSNLKEREGNTFF